MSINDFTGLKKEGVKDFVATVHKILKNVTWGRGQKIFFLLLALSQIFTDPSRNLHVWKAKENNKS